jgi:hypothetical protein
MCVITDNDKPRRVCVWEDGAIKEKQKKKKKKTNDWRKDTTNVQNKTQRNDKTRVYIGKLAALNNKIKIYATVR